jgi:uncharacterized Zn finger protein (UPF0148 family)
MPIYVCPKCGRRVKLPKGTYYCKVCGPDVIMVEETSIEKKAEYAVNIVEATDRIAKMAVEVQQELGVSDEDMERIVSDIAKGWFYYKERVKRL